MKTKEVHAYDPKSGDYVRSYPSATEAEKALSVYSDGIGSTVRKGRQTVLSGFLWSYEKMPNFGGLLESPSPTIKKRGMSVRDFRKKHDAIEIIREGVKKLRRDDLITQAQFVADLKFPGGVSYRDKLMLEEFEPYRGMVNANDVRWGHPDDIADLKADGLLK